MGQYWKCWHSTNNVPLLGSTGKSDQAGQPDHQWVEEVPELSPPLDPVQLPSHQWVEDVPQLSPRLDPVQLPPTTIVVAEGTQDLERATLVWILDKFS